jgi:[acyl-carrier-protein] S-malonyltransferase
MMKQAGIALARELEQITINDLNFPIVNNADAKYLRMASELRPSLVKQISAPLYWEDSISMMVTDGCDTFVEIGPGKVLSGLVRRISKESKVLNVEDQKSMNETLTTLGI